LFRVADLVERELMEIGHERYLLLSRVAKIKNQIRIAFENFESKEVRGKK
jgi:hypothetical protein